MHPKMHQNKFNEYLRIKGYSIKTIQGTLYALDRFTRWAEKENIPLQAISYNDLLVYMNHCKKQGNKARSVQITIGKLKHYYAFLQSEKEVEENPCSGIDIKGVKRKHLYETLTKEELEIMYKTYRSANALTEKRNKLMIGLLIYQGLRSEELERLTIADIHLREGTLTITGSRRTNGRELKLESNQLLDIIDYINETRKHLMQVRGKESEKLFISMGKGAGLKNSIARLIKQLKEQNKKLKNLKHLRASVITGWLKQHHIRKVQVMAGHRYISSTEAYESNNLDELKEDINKYHPIY
jgi:site-specific recombinase XerD